MKPRVRKNRCRCEHCGDKWTVEYGNYARKAMTWQLAMRLANDLIGTEAP